MSFHPPFRVPANKWATIYETPNVKSYETEVILVHDLHKKSDLREILETTVEDVCLAAHKSVDVTFRISVYRFSYKKLRDIGEFKESFTELLAQVQKLLVSRSIKSNLKEKDNSKYKSRHVSQNQVDRARQPPQFTPKILFITYELGAWLVRNLFFHKTSDLTSSNFKDFENPVRRLAGIIFLGADGDEGFLHSRYLEQRLEGTSDSIPTLFIVDKLQSIDANFVKSLKRESSKLASTIWILSTLTTFASYPSTSSPNRTASGLSLPPKSKSLRNPFRSKSIRNTTGNFTSATKVGKSEDSMSDDTGRGGPLDFSRRVLQGLIVACHGQNESDQISQSSDNFLYIKRIKSQSILEDSSGTEDSTNATPHLAPIVVEPDKLRRHTSNESARSSFYGGHEDGAPLSVPRSEPETPLDGSYDHMSQLSLQSTRESHLREFVDTMPEIHGPWEMSGDSKREVEENMLLAQSYMKRGDFEKAERLYDKCARLNQQMQPPSDELVLRVAIQKALIGFQRGGYMNTLTALEALWESHSTQHPHLLEVDQITYQLAVVLTRLGDHHKAFQKLEILKSKIWFQDIQSNLEEVVGPLPQYILVDPRVEIVLSTTRLTALLWAYYGHYREAKKAMAIAEALWAKFVRARRKERVSASAATKIHHKLGSSTAPQDSNRDSTQQHPKESLIDVKGLEAKIYLARAKILMLKGDDEQALLSIRRTLRRLETQLGRKHILTLEAVALHALILSRRFEGEAESVCITAINTMTQILGREHPLTMEVMSTLVSIFLRQSRPYEARDTIAALLEQATDRLGSDNPQTLRYQCLLGDVDLYTGNYRKAKEELELVYQAATRKWIDQEPLGQYPDVLRCLSKLALANSCMGKSTGTRERAKQALIEQGRIYRAEIAEGEELEDEYINYIFDRLELKRDPGYGIIPHPDVLEALAIYVSILERNEISQPEIILEAYERLYKLREASDSYGEGHFLTLQSGLDFAFACLDSNEIGQRAIGDPADFFSRKYDECERYLGPNHILTWRAKLGDTFTRGLGEYGEERFKSEVSKIIRGQTALLGQSHPIVLDSLSRLFVVQLMLHDDAAHATADLLLTQVRKHNIREQRLIETLQIEQRVAEMYCAIQNYEQGLPIFEKIVTFLDDHGRENERDGDLEEERNSFGAKLQDDWDRARQAGENFCNKLAKDVDLLSTESYGDVEALKRRVASLSRTLYGESKPETAKALLSLAEFLHTSKDIQKRDEGLQILGELRADIGQAMLKNKEGDERLYEQLTDMYEEWQDTLYRTPGVEWQGDNRYMGQEQAVWDDYYATGDSKGKGREEEGNSWP